MIVPESFSTSRLFLRRSKESDAPAVFEYGGDPEVARYADWPGSRAWTRRGEPSSVRLAAGKQVKSTRGGLPCGLTTLPSEALPVASAVAALSWDSSCVTGSVIVATPRKPRTLCSSRWHHCRTSIEFRQRAIIENSASARVLEKLGMRRDCVLRRWAMRPNLLENRFAMPFSTPGYARPDRPLQPASRSPGRQYLGIYKSIEPL